MARKFAPTTENLNTLISLQETCEWYTVATFIPGWQSSNVASQHHSGLSLHPPQDCNRYNTISARAYGLQFLSDKRTQHDAKLLVICATTEFLSSSLWDQVTVMWQTKYCTITREWQPTLAPESHSKQATYMIDEEQCMRACRGVQSSIQIARSEFQRQFTTASTTKLITALRIDT